MESEELEEIKRAIREIDQEKAVTEKRFERFSEAVERIKAKNREHLETIGVSSMEELKQLILGQPINAEGVQLFVETLKEKGISPPDFLKHIQTTNSNKISLFNSPPSSQWEKGKSNAESDKKKKRVKFKL